MDLNTLKPASGSRKNARRVGRGIGSGLGKTCGRGHKGQKSRSGGFHKLGFEGGQMPIQRRLPKTGFSSKVGLITDEVRLSELQTIEQAIIDVDVLRANGVINKNIKRVKVILSGELDHAVTLKGIRVTKGARQVIENLGGTVEE